MTNLVRWDPITELSALQKQFFGDDWVTPFKGISTPTTDVFTKDNQLVVEAHLPNFNQDDVDISLENNSLIINAERHEQEQDKTKQYVVRESSSSFYRRIALPERANVDDIKAHLEDGVLKVSIPLTPLPQPKKINISTKNKTK